MSVATFSEDDRGQLAERGISLEEAERQIALFRRPTSYVRLERPCTIGDGIEAIPPVSVPELHAAHARAASEGRFLKFVPASGAASRMFRELLHFVHGGGAGLGWTQVVELARAGDPDASTLLTFVENLKRFAFVGDLERVVRERSADLHALARAGEFRPILEALLDDSGLGYAGLPKGLLGFHVDDHGARTPFEEHLVEGADHARGGDGASRIHFTVSPEHEQAFAALLDKVAGRYAKRLNTEFRIDYSVQKPSTDTLAVGLDNQPLRDADGKLQFRPGGHGALIENLDDLKGDLVFVKNIDNVQPDWRKSATLEWKKTLAGHLVVLQRSAFEALGRLRSGADRDETLTSAMSDVGRRLHMELNGHPRGRSALEKRSFLIDRLDRPIRVCGVVPNTGEPGGGPFWVRGGDGRLSLQIVESAQVDPHDAEQQRIFRSSTHFNPVDLVCGVRDSAGRPFDLRRFIDRDAVIVTQKSAAGRDLKALERPGLWNGAMAGWNTVFVEVPLATFSPVKSILDLLRDEHQPAK